MIDRVTSESGRCHSPGVYSEAAEVLLEVEVLSKGKKKKKKKKKKSMRRLCLFPAKSSLRLAHH